MGFDRRCIAAFHRENVTPSFHSLEIGQVSVLYHNSVERHVTPFVITP